jgi:hypothetical protein
MLFALCLLTCCASCINKGGTDCPYNLHITYRYDIESTVKGNYLGAYVDELQTYIFNGLGGLIYADTLRDGSLEIKAALDPDDDYTIVAIGNINEDIDYISGISLLESCMVEPSPLSDTLSAVGDRLYYGYAQVKIGKKSSSDVVVDMEAAFCRLNVAVSFADDVTPTGGIESCYLMLAGEPSHLMFTPGYSFEDEDGSMGYFPLPSGWDEPLTYRAEASADNQQWRATFITYPLRYPPDNEKLMLGVYTNDGVRMAEVDIYQYFRERQIDLNTYRAEAFALKVEISKNEVLVSDDASNDWNNGGSL